MPGLAFSSFFLIFSLFCFVVVFLVLSLLLPNPSMYFSILPFYLSLNPNSPLFHLAHPFLFLFFPFSFFFLFLPHLTTCIPINDSHYLISRVTGCKNIYIYIIFPY